MNINAIKTQLKDIETTHLCDASPNVKFLEPTYQIMGNMNNMIGFAYTVDCNGGFTSILEAMKHIKPHDVLVIQTQNCKNAVLGGFFINALKKLGTAGMIVDGYCRDRTDLIASGLPIALKGTVPKVGCRSSLGKQQIPVNCFNAEIHPGDLIVADDDGIIVIPKDEVKTTIEKGRLVQQKEMRVQAKVDEGHPFLSLMNIDEHLDALKKGEHSEARFNID